MQNEYEFWGRKEICFQKDYRKTLQEHGNSYKAYPVRFFMNLISYSANDNAIF